MSYAVFALSAIAFGLTIGMSIVNIDLTRTREVDWKSGLWPPVFLMFVVGGFALMLGLFSVN